MVDKQINAAVEMYQQTHNQEVFSDLYNQLKPRLKKRVRKESVIFRLDEGEVWGVIHESLLKAVEKFDSTKGNFMNLFYKILRNELDRIKKKLSDEKKNKYELISIDDDADDEMPQVQVSYPFEYVTDELAVRNIQRKIEQRKLLQSMNIPPSIFALLDRCDPSIFESKTALGRALGFDYPHQQVNRLFKQIRKSYDFERFGNPSDYFSA